MRARERRPGWVAWGALLWLPLLGCGHLPSQGWESLAVGHSLAACQAREDAADVSAATSTQGGCTLRMLDGQGGAARGGNKVALLFVPAAAGWQTHVDRAGAPADVWRERLGAQAVFNAGFYDANSQHVGWLKSQGAWTQQQGRTDWYGALLSAPTDPQAPPLRLLDLLVDDAAARADYAHGMQTMMFLDDGHGQRCCTGPEAASRCLLATDAEGAFYILVTQGGWAMPQLARWLRATLPQLTRVLNLDGGLEAQLAVGTEAGPFVLAGEQGRRGPSVLFGRKMKRSLPAVWSIGAGQAP